MSEKGFCGIIFENVIELIVISTFYCIVMIAYVAYGNIYVYNCQEYLIIFIILS
jgi:hypothetical protein